jgi:membrane protein implicated in regulation of membrane protease activity
MSLEFQAALWAVLALVALIIEVTHRTFYLLIVCIAFVLAMCVVLVFHAGTSVQLALVVVASLVGIPLAGKLRQRNSGLHFPADQGQTVKVIRSKDGRLRVLYRGTEWDAVYPGPEPVPGETLKIQELHGNTLKLTSL